MSENDLLELALDVAARSTAELTQHSTATRQLVALHGPGRRSPIPVTDAQPLARASGGQRRAGDARGDLPDSDLGNREGQPLVDAIAARSLTWGGWYGDFATRRSCTSADSGARAPREVPTRSRERDWIGPCRHSVDCPRRGDQPVGQARRRRAQLSVLRRLCVGRAGRLAPIGLTGSPLVSD